MQAIYVILIFWQSYLKSEKKIKKDEINYNTTFYLTQYIQNVIGSTYN